MAYPVVIGRIADVHPILLNNPQIINLVPLHGVFASKNAGDALDRQALQEAEETVDNLRSAHRLLPALITNDMVQSSKIRLQAMQSAHAANDFQQAPDLVGLHALIQNNHNAIIDRLDHISAYMRNTRIINKNRSQPTNPVTPLVKHLPGDGHAIAEPLRPLNVTPAMLQNYQPNGAVGTIPPNFNYNIDNYTNLDILKLIIFYNDDFGITADDALHEQKVKIRNGFAEYMV